ncbi:hypothetical protein B0H13DRAFT_1910735 [Mycena leptocephala]|nr:hypothetical protein B0H13DRAFT_1910735 [Mycena leptocephala]
MSDGAAQESARCAAQGWHGCSITPSDLRARHDKGDMTQARAATPPSASATKILGATDKEVDDSIVFEEILHRLPELKRLKASQRCAAAAAALGLKSFNVANCAQHAGVDKSTSRSFDTPDLCIAFNSAAAEDCKSWRRTLEVLLQRKIPSIFTADNFEDANVDSAALTGAGASFHSERGVLVAITAEFLVGSIDGLTESGKILKEFVGMVLLSIVGNAAEHVSAVTVAVMDKMKLSIGVAVGSSITERHVLPKKIGLFVIP